jgi:hypothetical protein
MTLAEKFWLWALLQCINHVGFPYLDIVRDKTGEEVEAITMAMSETYINAVANIEVGDDT